MVEQLRQKAPLFYPDSSIVSFDRVFLNTGPDSAVILAGVSRLDAQQIPSASVLGSLPSTAIPRIQGGIDVGFFLGGGDEDEKEENDFISTEAETNGQRFTG